MARKDEEIRGKDEKETKESREKTETAEENTEKRRKYGERIKKRRRNDGKHGKNYKKHGWRQKLRKRKKVCLVVGFMMWKCYFVWHFKYVADSPWLMLRTALTNTEKPKKTCEVARRYEICEVFGMQTCWVLVALGEYKVSSKNTKEWKGARGRTMWDMTNMFGLSSLLRVCCGCAWVHQKKSTKHCASTEHPLCDKCMTFFSLSKSA